MIGDGDVDSDGDIIIGAYCLIRSTDVFISFAGNAENTNQL